jgi:hypothetical protein
MPIVIEAVSLENYINLDILIKSYEPLFTKYNMAIKDSYYYIPEINLSIDEYNIPIDFLLKNVLLCNGPCLSAQIENISLDFIIEILLLKNYVVYVTHETNLIHPNIIKLYEKLPLLNINIIGYFAQYMNLIIGRDSGLFYWTQNKMTIYKKFICFTNARHKIHTIFNVYPIYNYNIIDFEKILDNNIDIIIYNNVDNNFLSNNTIYSVNSSNNSKSLGDVFLSLLQFNKNKSPFIFLTHTAHLSICKLFAYKIDILIILDNAYEYNNLTYNIHSNYINFINYIDKHFIYNQIIKIKENIIFKNILNDYDVIIYPYRSDNNKVNDNILNMIVNICSTYNLNIYTHINKNHINYSNETVIPNTKEINLSLDDLISITNKKIIIISNRSGLLDILYYISNFPIINLIPNDPLWIKDYTFDKNKINLPNLYRDNVYDIFYDDIF